MTRSTLLLSTALGLAMVVSASADAKNVPGFMSRGAYNAQGHAGHIAPPVLDKGKAKLIARYERGFSTYSYYKGVSGISNPVTGVYCITPTKPLASTLNPQVTLEWSYSSGFSFIDFWENNAFDCASGNVEVRTYDASGNPTENSAFVVIVDN